MDGFDLTYPTANGQLESKQVRLGSLLFLVGANGSGKSTLMQRFSTQNHGKIRRITAHRQVWFNSNTIDLTPASREQSERNILNQDQQAQARWRDDFAAQRAQMTIFDLIDSENVESRKIADAARAGDMATVTALAELQSPMSKMNDILKISNLAIQIHVDQGSKLIAKREGAAPYSIAELSDGERNAILIIANVLTAPPHTLILLDEPERHLHRSIVSPLISTLLSHREDCAFVISTHDISLPLDQEKSSALLVRAYNHSPQFWTADYIEAVEDMDEYTAKAVLGSRKIILFIEGNPSSLDLQIYQILFPNLSIKPVGNCVQVEKIIYGLCSSEKIHWICGVGIIDRDNRSDEECASLESIGIVPIEQYSIESIYYHPITFNLMATRISLIHSIDINETIESMIDSFISHFEPHKTRMAARLVQRKASDLLVRQSPDWKSILDSNVSINFSTEGLLKEENETIDQLIRDKDIARITSRYPVRETPALEAISKLLHFSSKKDYEQAVRKMLVDDESAKNAVLKLMKPVVQYIETLNQTDPAQTKTDND
jgi:ABC-type cobalamin/Fe3+-siderophores transport system ATPase subunit